MYKNIAEPAEPNRILTAIIPVEGESEVFLVNVGLDIGLVRWSVNDPPRKKTKIIVLTSVDKDRPQNRLNEARCDSKGRLWTGTVTIVAILQNYAYI